MKADDILTTYLRGNLAGYLAGAFLVAGASLLSAVVPWQLGLFADRFGRGSLKPDDAAMFSLEIAGVCLARAILWWLGCDVILRKGRELIYLLRRRLLDTWSSMPFGFYHGRSTGDLVSHALSDVEVIRELVSMELCMTISGLSLLASVVCMMVIHGDWRLTIAGLGPLLVIPLLVKMLGPGLKRLSRRCQEALGGMAQTVEEIFSGIRTVKAF